MQPNENVIIIIWQTLNEIDAALAIGAEKARTVANDVLARVRNK